MAGMGADIVLLDTEWPSRSLLRAQLIEEGFDVLATDTWATMRPYLRPGSRPQLAIVDLHGLPLPEQVLADLHVLMPPERVLVLSALGTIEDEALDRLGFRYVKRPIAVADVVAAARNAMRRSRGQ
jgi:DNA-binding response OmpR family regulator